MHSLVPFFESVMLICFGLSWPVAILKTLRTRNVKGMSPFFLGIIEVGYLAGILFKCFGQCDWVLGLYLLNLVLVGIELGLYLRFSPLDREAQANPAPQG